MPRTGLIGHTGFVGSNLSRAFSFDGCYNTQNIQDIRGQHFDLLICAAPQAKKWWANQHPEEDKALLDELIEHLKQVQAERFFLVSTIDVFPRITDADESFDCASQPNHAYGRHRLILEQFVVGHFPKTHVVRLPGLFGPGLKKNVIFDFLNQNQLEKINPESQFQWYDVARLWDDLQTIQANDIRLMVFATEPLKTADIQANFFPRFQVGTEAGPAVAYNIHTCHATAFGGTNGYMLSRQQVLEDIGHFVHSLEGNKGEAGNF